MAETPEQAEILDVPLGVWDQFRGARIFLTGGTGFFGHALLTSFLYANQKKKLGASLIVLSRNPEAFLARFPQYKNDAIRFHTGDVRDFTVPEGRFTHVIHAATESSGMQRHHSDLHMVDTIIGGTRHVLDFAKANQARMLYVSSGAVYGRTRPQPTPIAETETSAPRLDERTIAYDESKRMAEALCTLYHHTHNLSVTIARGFSFVGPHLPLNEHFAIGNFIGDALVGRSIIIHSDGSAIRSYLYTSDLARFLWTMLAQGQPAVAYNLGSGEEVSVATLANRVQQIVNRKIGIDIKGVHVPNSAVSYQVPDMKKVAAELGLKPLVTLDEAIHRTAEWYRAHPEAMVPPRDIPAPTLLGKPDVVVFDFDGVMTDNRVAVSEDGRETVFCDRSDGLGIGMLKEAGIPMIVISKETNPVVGMRCKKLGIEWLQGIDTKEIVLAKWLKEKGFSAAKTIYLGNDINDLGCLKMVGLPVVVGDAYPEARAAAKLVLTRHGGKGAVRELADLILAARGN